jgi:hypothetical protein
MGQHGLSRRLPMIQRRTVVEAFDVLAIWIAYIEMTLTMSLLYRAKLLDTYLGYYYVGTEAFLLLFPYTMIWKYFRARI